MKLNGWLRAAEAAGIFICGAGLGWGIWVFATSEEVADKAGTLLAKQDTRRIFRRRDGSRIVLDSAEVHKIVTPKMAASSERLKFVGALPSILPVAEREALSEYIRNGKNSDIEYVIKNDLMNVLRRDAAFHSGTTALLLELCSDRKQDRVVRAYALQHLRPQYEASPDPAIKAAYMAVLEEPDSELAGGALLALNYLAKEYPEDFDGAEIAVRAAALASDPQAHTAARTSAFQVAAMLGSDAMLPAARAIAPLEDAPVALRASALAALGRRGDMTDAGLLESIAGSESPCRVAAGAALSNLLRRMRQ